MRGEKKKFQYYNGDLDQAPQINIDIVQITKLTVHLVSVINVQRCMWRNQKKKGERSVEENEKEKKGPHVQHMWLSTIWARVLFAENRPSFCVFFSLCAFLLQHCSEPRETVGLCVWSGQTYKYVHSDPQSEELTMPRRKKAASEKNEVEIKQYRKKKRKKYGE